MTKEASRVTTDSGVVKHFSFRKANYSRRKRLCLPRLRYTRQRKSLEIPGLRPRNGGCNHLQRKESPLIGTEGGAVGNRKEEISLCFGSRFLDDFKGVAFSGFGDRSHDSAEEGGSHGWVSVKGRRKEMEDTVKVELGFATIAGQRYDFFGVYDGHGGASVAEACRERLHVVVETEMEIDQSNDAAGEGFWGRVMERGFTRMDAEVGAVESLNSVGSTAVVALVGLQELVIANCGDCRAVLSRDGRAMAVSNDHKPDREDEFERIENAGGKVINWNGYRVFGVLATSRSIGDQCLKPFIIPTPEVTVMDREAGDEFLVLASDGLWDVVSNDLACRVVRKCLTRPTMELSQENPSARAAALLAELAVARGSEDNISVAVIDLGRKPEIQAR